MATYKVPQNVEADDKLLGPFSFRQFIYLMVAAGAIFLAWLLSRIFILLALIPTPVIFFFAILALPIKKDQPMETYLAALVAFYIKPRKRLWTPGQRESTILITAPKQTEPKRTRDISEEEAVNRLSFLSNLVDTEGYAIKSGDTPIREEYLAEATTATDILDNSISSNINQIINKEQTTRHNELLNQMRTAIERADSFAGLYQQQPSQPTTVNSTIITPSSAAPNPTIIQPTPAVQPTIPATQPNNVNQLSPTNQTTTPTTTSLSPPSTTQPVPQATKPDLSNTSVPNIPAAPTVPAPAIVNLVNNKDFSIQTIQKEAKRLKEQEVYISLH